MAYASLFFNILILAALAYTIFYCIKLSKQFKQMQADRRAFETLIQSLNLAAARAESAIRTMKETAAGSGENLQEKINQSRASFSELEIMIQAADDAANRLQNFGTREKKPETPDTQLRTRAERELQEAMRTKQT